jgi:hypothetical protein
MKRLFDRKELEGYQESPALGAWLEPVLQNRLHEKDEEQD